MIANVPSGAGTVPERRPRSCPPPLICACSRTRGLRRTYSAPTPLGPYILCPLMDMRSTPHASTSTGILPAACAASVWKNRLRSPVFSRTRCNMRPTQCK